MGTPLLLSSLQNSFLYRRFISIFVLQNYQVPYLDQWTDIEGEHSSCLGGVTTALHNASLRLPVIGNVKVRFAFKFCFRHKLHQLFLCTMLSRYVLKFSQANCEEITDVLTSAAQLLEPLSPCVGNFLPKVRSYLEICINKALYISLLSEDAFESCSISTNFNISANLLHIISSI